MKKFRALKKALLSDEETRNHYKDLKLEFRLLEQIISKRLERGLSQKALAEKIKTKQSAIARLESGRYNPSLLFLKKVASALESNLIVEIR